ncbi:CPXCG motif-containing cysteine-rich protein [Amphritea opalescens]|uniref:CPXCG motif-containing cysteine-rich protein n=1 Tax=Amphritea opalescens TaxID=2490544 RepID=A0A430KQI9_9GAMM|nr:CPXCG motif-containing cysteine-rich protein [Amphritea opalescens]RTE65777.1 CPXCG motif-containing cysteine-rich protein [Amphritea opalescens]
MRSLESISDVCPYCGEPIELLVDCSAGDQEYIEDCQVCCKPITVELKLDGLEPEVTLKSENEV